MYKAYTYLIHFELINIGKLVLMTHIVDSISPLIKYGKQKHGIQNEELCC